MLFWQEIRPKDSTKNVKAQNTKLRKPGGGYEVDMETSAISTVTLENQPFGGVGGL